MRLNSLQITSLCSLYELGASTYQLSEEYGISQPAVYKLLKRRAIILRSASDARRKLKLNELAFERITEESAYWIGFLMANGSIIRRGPASVEIAIALQASDISHLERFRSFLDSSHTITSFGVQKQVYRFAVRSKRLADALAIYGVAPERTHATKVIGLETNRDFWRGVIDGKGFFGQRDQQVRLELAGPMAQLEQFLSFLYTFIPDCKLMVLPHRSRYRIASRNCTAYLIVKTLYENCSIALPRKLEVASSILI